MTVSRIINTAAVMLTATVLLTSCVHEWPDDARRQRTVFINVSHALEWTQHDITVSRTGAINDGSAYFNTARYHFQVYTADNLGVPVAETQFTRDDLNRGDFTTAMQLPAGDYILHAWSDIADASTGKSLFYDTENFSRISYSEPYNGNNDLRDAFRGVTAFTVAETYEAGYSVSVNLPMERPLARYEFISTDLVDFLEGEASRGMITYSRGDSPANIPSRVPEFNKYRVRMIYSGYMPSVFNNLTDKPVDSRTGVSYDARITILNDREARLGFDHVMVNGSESSVAVALEVYDPNDRLIGRVNTVNVPTKRSRNTTVRGRFLTSNATGGVGISPGFNGQFNIEIH